MNGLERKIYHTIQRQSLIAPHARVVVALSGGSDSVALLCVLKNLGYNCIAAHFNFHLRGEESMRDEHFVRDLCRKTNTPLRFCEADTRKFATESKQSLEMAARELRYSFFASIAEETGAPVAVAHHRDDNAETLMLNLIRGTGLKGLCGMDYKTTRTIAGKKPMVIIRPMLDIARKDITEYLNDIKQDFVTDSTNFVADVKRNKIRLELIPAMSEINPSISETLQRETRKFSSVYIIYQKAVREILSQISVNQYGDEILTNETLCQSPAPEAILFEWLSQKKFNETQISQIAQCSTEDCKQIETDEFLLIADRKSYTLIRKNSLPQPTETQLPLQGTIRIAHTAIALSTPTQIPPADILRNPQYAFFDMQKIKLPLVIRPIKSGDRFIPFGMRGSKLVNDFLKDEKIPTECKMRQLVVCDQEKILWITGRRTDNRARISPDTQTILQCKILPTAQQ